MSQRLSSGEPRLDSVLAGGLVENSIALLTGAPGTGKSVLAQQYVFANATPERPCTYLSTVSEPLEKTLRFAQTLSFFDTEAVGRWVRYEDGGQVLRSGGLDGVLAWLEARLQDPPGVLVIDSFKAIHDFAPDPEQFRGFLHDAAGLLSASPTTSLWIGEYHEREEAARTPEAAVADAIVHLSTARASQREVRTLQVLKLRGSGFPSGQHAYRITAEGLRVFPRLADPDGWAPDERSTARLSSGLPVLDEMLAGGLPTGSSTLIVGPTGSGKTHIGMRLLLEAARRGERCVVAALEDNPVYVRQRMVELGLEPRDNVELLYRSLVDVYIDQWVYDLLDVVERTGASWVLVDSLDDLQTASDDPVRFREYLYSMLQRCARLSVNIVMTLEVGELFRFERLSHTSGISNLADTVILLQYVRGPTELQRALIVLKTQGASNDLRSRQFSITANGVEIGDVLRPRSELS